ncbi:YfgM family protein [Permianibacter aggregans]|uniref:Putative negative regulator of RcsB-dependent stress response n=1 Tax=Permianibacter aggregans TaxID=1510150 RepID=A0A4R6UX44_9GAMM|nr:tetratricopeptide repeat protein [Permianibacter aggregans]TDQ48164.1 putative negative regulator of RcsB-dependent stress response [Permianibacter aggregans]
MDEILTEEQQLEKVRQWWKDNGVSVVLGLVLGLGALAGWRFWQSHQSETAMSASAAFEQVVKLSEQADKKAEFVAAAEALAKDHQGTVYAQFGQLYLARASVNDADLDKAAGLLQAVVNEAAHPALKHTATLRLARIRLAQGNAEQALQLAQISKDDAGTYHGAYAMVRGDALLALNREAEAHAAFEEAKAAGDVIATHPELDLKLDVTSL